MLAQDPSLPLSHSSFTDNVIAIITWQLEGQPDPSPSWLSQKPSDLIFMQTNFGWWEWGDYFNLEIVRRLARDPDLEMGPDPTRAYFWPAVKKRPTRLWPGYFPTLPEDILFDPRGKKLKNLTFLEEIFQILIQAINGWSDPGQKILTQTHHYPDPRPKRKVRFWKAVDSK